MVQVVQEKDRAQREQKVVFSYTTKMLITPQIYSRAGTTVGGDFGRALDAGCGMKKIKGFIGLDIIPEADIVHDMNVLPWPFEKNSFDLVLTNSTLEHVVDVQKTLEEIHRILVPGGRLIVKVPHFRAIDAFVDPTHFHFFGAYSMDFFAEGTHAEHYHYTTKQFRKLAFWYGWPHPSKNFLKRWFVKFITKHPRLYDQWLSLLVPIKCIFWELEVVKK